ncbi:TonB-dependent receptor domain-containing protein [Mucilaginibacter sp. X4EP1]|uniref:TonB-dependent receptor n=1 Tax=Mucilaginibacter sp. X4EP1 TaxID=2723092 RepID=UPI00216AAF34|nr:TonB-dependent receptor [Mucilaginibacter sp. X4EP1]MCS3813455.1 outer membrane receptor protein involved in Fe transport [Mucilaginibacter sp. X4EP1]
MRSLLLKTLPILLLIGIRGLSIAQSPKPANGVNGTLTDDAGKPMEYATISLVKLPDSIVVKGTLTNEAGIYNLGITASGNYLVKATSVGYAQAVSLPFTISDPQSGFSIPVITMHSAGNSLNTVVITASKPLIEHKTDMTVMNIANSVLATGNNALEILARAPGVTLDQDDNIRLRGKKGVTVMINGKLTYLSSAQLATLLKSTDGTTIQSIEIITNPSAKYDASGSSGIINIRLKKSNQSGTNGSFITGVGYGNSWKDNQTLSLNHKDGDLNVYGSFSHYDGKYDHHLLINRTVADSLGGKTYFNQVSSSPATIHNNSYRVGADYDITSTNTAGFMVNGYFDKVYEDDASLTNIGSSPGELDSYLNTLSRINNSYDNFAVNLNDRLKLDTLGQSLAVDLDYSRFNNGQDAYHHTYYYEAEGSTMIPPAFLLQQSPSVIIIHTAKADYTLPLNKTLKFETGVKYSDVKTDNNLAAQQQVNGSYLNDSTLTNHFIYTEKIGAGYVNLSKSFKNTSVEIGLRGEYTSSTGDLVTDNDVVKRHYFDLFPSLFVNHTLNDKNEVGFSFSRRIDRPDYDDLNPFVYYLDQYTYSKGNPFLNPQYTNSFELSYTYNKTINASFSYSHTSDLMTTVLLTDPLSEATYQTKINLQAENAYTINVNAPFTLTDWWNINVDANGFYTGFKSDTLLGASYNKGKIAYQAKLMQTFQLAKGYKAELISSYFSSLYDGIYLVSSNYSTDAGVSHSFAGNRANIKLAMSDVFNTLKDHFVTDYQVNDIAVSQKRETRITRLTFTYNFGNSKIKPHEHTTGADDLSGRVKGNN